MSAEVQRDLGRLEARADSTDERLDSTDERLERIELKVDQIVQWMQQSRGSLKALLAVGSVAGAIGAAVAKVVAFLKGAS